LRGELVALQQHNVLPAELGEVEEDRTADDTAADNRHLGMGFHRLRLRLVRPATNPPVDGDVTISRRHVTRDGLPPNRMGYRGSFNIRYVGFGWTGATSYFETGLAALLSMRA
jgi:hypothetical protein